MDIENSPSEETRNKVADITMGRLGLWNCYDILDQKLSRAIGISGLISSAAIEPEKTALSFQDLGYTASILKEELETAHAILEGWWKDNIRPTPPHPFTRLTRE